MADMPNAEAAAHLRHLADVYETPAIKQAVLMGAEALEARNRPHMTTSEAAVHLRNIAYVYHTPAIRQAVLLGAEALEACTPPGTTPPDAGQLRRDNDKAASDENTVIVVAGGCLWVNVLTDAQMAKAFDGLDDCIVHFARMAPGKNHAVIRNELDDDPMVP